MFSQAHNSQTESGVERSPEGYDLIVSVYHRDILLGLAQSLRCELEGVVMTLIVSL